MRLIKIPVFWKKNPVILKKNSSYFEKIPTMRSIFFS